MIVKSKQVAAVRLFIVFWTVTSPCLAVESGADSGADARLPLAQQTIIDPEEVEGSFEDRVRVMQEWLRQREAQRRHEDWGRDVVSPQVPPPPRSSSSRYFEERGYDERGFRRLEGNIRVRLRGLDEDPVPYPDAGDPFGEESSVVRGSSRSTSSAKSQRSHRRQKGTRSRRSKAHSKRR